MIPCYEDISTPENVNPACFASVLATEMSTSKRRFEINQGCSVASSFNEYNTAAIDFRSKYDVIDSYWGF